MQSTATARLPATSPVRYTLPLTSITVACLQVPEPRRRQGTRSPLAALLTLAVAARLANHRSLLALAAWAADQSEELKRALGFPTGRTPHVSTLHRVFRRLDPAAREHALTDCFDPQVPGEVRARGTQGVAVDGKAQRGRLPHARVRTHPVPAVSAVCHDLGVVLAQIAVRSQQHAAELTVAPTLLRQLAWQGRVLTGAALSCQRTLCAPVVEAGGDYLVLVDDNQPTLPADMQQLFAPAPPPWPGHAACPIEEERASQVEKGHGRLAERTLRLSAELAEYVDWPALTQVLQVTRTWTRPGVTQQEIRCGSTSLPRAVAGAAHVFALQRGHWCIENRWHYVKAVPLGADQSSSHCEAGPQIMAALRNTAIGLLRRAGYHASAARRRYHSRHPEAILPVLGLAPL